MGGFIFPLLFQRPMMSWARRTFRVGRGFPEGQAVRVPERALGETFKLSVGTAVMGTDMRARAQDRFWLADASEEGGAFGFAPVSHALARQVWGLTEKKGGATQVKNRARVYLEKVGVVEEEDEGGRGVAPWIRDLCNALPYQEARRWKWGKRSHVNLLERRTASKLVEHCALEAPDCATGEMPGDDSRVAMSCGLKGRARSPSLN